MILKKAAFSIAFIVVSVILVYTTWIVGDWIKCEVRGVRNPTAPLPENTTLVRSDVSSHFDAGVGNLDVYYYSTESGVYDVIDFYRQRSSCNAPPTSKRIVCRGDAEPDGIYYAYLEVPNSGPDHPTEFTIEVQWYACKSSEQVSGSLPRQ